MAIAEDFSVVVGKPIVLKPMRRPEWLPACMSLFEAMHFELAGKGHIVERELARERAPIEVKAALRAGIDPERVEMSTHKGCIWLTVLGDVSEEEACEIAETFDRLDAEWSSLVVYASNARHGFSRVDLERVAARGYEWCSVSWNGLRLPLAHGVTVRSSPAAEGAVPMPKGATFASLLDDADGAYSDTSFSIADAGVVALSGPMVIGDSTTATLTDLEAGAPLPDVIDCEGLSFGDAYERLRAATTESVLTHATPPECEPPRYVIGERCGTHGVTSCLACSQRER